MTITTIQVLEMISKLQSHNLNPEITMFGGDFLIYYDDLLGRGMNEFVIITGEGEWKGYGWGFEEFMSVLDREIKAKNETDET
jgi:hypothetical protein